MKMKDFLRIKGKAYSRLIFFGIGILSTVWFLFRVLPKPSRATYPCMRAAAPFMSGFVIYLLSLASTVMVFKKARTFLYQTRYLLFLGALLLIYIQSNDITVVASDDIFPIVAIRYLGPIAGLVFLIGLISAAFPSADGALTSLTTSVSIDFLNLDKREDISELTKTRIRYFVHIMIALIFFISIIIFSTLNDMAVIDKLFTIA